MKSAVHVQRPEPLSAIQMERMLQIYNEIKQYTFPPIAGTPEPSKLLNAQKYIQLYGVRDLEDLPEDFSWVGEGYIQRSLNQYSCGACWAFSMASVISDRYAIAMEKAGHTPVNPVISPTAVTFCVSEKDNSDGSVRCGQPRTTPNSRYCNGCCETLSAYQTWALSPGMPSMECVAKKQCSDDENFEDQMPKCDFNWCTTRETIRFKCDMLTPADYKKIGSCDTFTKGCDLIQITNPIAIQGFVTDSSNNEENRIKTNANNLVIKRNLVSSGPLTVNFVVPNDFESWYSTPNMTPKDIYVFGALSSLTNGGHAVALVGYGTGYLTYTITSAPGIPIFQRYTIEKEAKERGQAKVSYWIARNSWGIEKGYSGGFFNFLAPGYETKEMIDMIPTRFANAVYAAEPILANSPKPAAYYECGPDRGTCMKSASKTAYTSRVFCGCDTCIPRCRGRCEGSDGCGGECSCSPLSKLDSQKIVLIVGGVVLVLFILFVLLR
jgi:hypothetical protein